MHDLGSARPAVILTRGAEANAPLRSELEAHGLRVIEMPCIRTEPAARDGLAGELAALTAHDVLVVTSPAGVRAVRAASSSTIAAPVAAVGPATAAEARGAGMRVTFVAARAEGAALGEELPLPTGSVVLARSDRAGRELPRILRERGARVREVVAYRTVPGASGDIEAAAAAIGAGSAVVVLASPSAVDGLLTAISPESARRAAIVAIGPTTASAVREGIGAEPITAADPSTAGVVRSVRSALGSEVTA